MNPPPLNRTVITAPVRPVKVAQFGSGNFLRGFADYIIDLLNEQTDFNGNVTIIQSIGSGTDHLSEQQGVYHVAVRGIADGKEVSELRLITSVSGTVHAKKDPDAFRELARSADLTSVISNTTEAGIVFREEPLQEEQLPETFPGKLTVFLLERFRANRNGLVILPCELIEQNGTVLRDAILRYCHYWQLPEDFKTWIERENYFCNTLVDRIVSGYSDALYNDIKSSTGYSDQVAVMTEPYYFWAIESAPAVQQLFPAHQIGPQVKFVDDIAVYRKRKVRILNGAHTALTPVAYLQGFRTVGSALKDPFIHDYLLTLIHKEIIPVLQLPAEETTQFAKDVIDRLQNPFTEHQLSSIALNSISKFKVRLLPTLLEYQQQYAALPAKIVHSLAALLLFYRGQWRDETLPLNDGPAILAFFREAWLSGNPATVSQLALQNEDLWGMDLSAVDGLLAAVTTELTHLTASE